MIVKRKRFLAGVLAVAGFLGCAGSAVEPASGADVSVVVQPQGAQVAPLGSVAFSAVVTGTADTTVTWSVQEASAGGSVSAAGLYTAPATTGTYHVEARSRADPGKSGVATIAVRTAGGGGGTALPMPVISRNSPAYASAGTAAAGNDGSYSSWWQIGGNGWIAYDLSAAPAIQRGWVVVVWQNAATYGYDLGYLGAPGYGVPQDYTVDAHAAAGGGPPPAATDPGWVTLAAVTGNAFTSRQHALSLTDGAGQAYNWVRLRIFATRNGNGVAIDLDVHDAHLGFEDDWLLLGDSITESCWRPGAQFAQLIQAARPGYFPAVGNGGIHGIRASDVLATRPGTSQAWVDYWLSSFPGRFVGLSYGTNDAASAGPASAFYANMEAIVQKVIAAGKTPVIPTIPYSPSPPYTSVLPGYNAQILALGQQYPEVVLGPDLYSLFQSNPSYLSADTVHPSDAGYAAMRRAWADAMLAAVY